MKTRRQRTPYEFLVYGESGIAEVSFLDGRAVFHTPSTKAGAKRCDVLDMGCEEQPLGDARGFAEAWAKAGRDDEVVFTKLEELFIEGDR